jgi:peptide chain release factor subunit 1
MLRLARLVTAITRRESLAATITWDALRQLAAFRAEHGCAISLYVDLDPSVSPTPGEAHTRVNSLLDEGLKSDGASRKDLTHDQRQGLRQDFQRVGRFFEQEFSRDGAHGVAVFCAGLDNFWRALPLTHSVTDEIKVGRELYLTPLVPLVGRGEGALVAVVSREQGHLYRLRGGRLEDVADHFDEQPRRHDQGGWSQANYQRHIDNLAHGHLRTVAEDLGRHVRRVRSARVVVVCAEELRTDFAEALPNEARQVIVGWTSAKAHATPAELLAVAKPELERSRTAEEAANLARWREEAGRNGRAASGWAETLEASSDGRVDLLLFQAGVQHEGWQCPACGRLGVAGGRCPLDGTEMERQSEGLDLAVHQTLAHGGSVWAVEHHHDLEPVEGIGALLRF